MPRRRRDLGAETNLVLWQRFDDFQPGTNFLAWAPAHRLQQDPQLSQRVNASRCNSATNSWSVCRTRPARTYQRDRAYLDAMNLCVEKLPPSERELIRLRYGTDATCQNVAETIGRSVQSVYKSLTPHSRPAARLYPAGNCQGGSPVTPLATPYRELDEILAALCDNAATPTEITRLESLADDAGALGYILDYMQMDGLLRWGKRKPARRTNRSSRPHAPLPCPLSILHFFTYFFVRFGGRLFDRHRGFRHRTRHRRAGARLAPDVDRCPLSGHRPKVWSGERTGGRGGRYSLSSSVVGRVHRQWSIASWNTDDCRMLNAELRAQTTDIHHSSFITQHSLLHLGDRLALRSGLLEITYDTGGKVILQGPVAYELESPAGGYLSVGKLTARLEKSFRGRR